MSDVIECVNCGSPNVFRKGRCDPCYRFLRKHRRDRTPEEFTRYRYLRWVAAQERALLRKMTGSPVGS